MYFISYDFEINASSSLSSWGTSRTLMKQNSVFLNLWFWGEAHASPFLTYLKFSINLCLEVRHEVRHMPHLYQTNFYVLNLCFLGWGMSLILLDMPEFFFLRLWLKMRHMPHPCKKNISFCWVLFCILWIFLS